MASDQKFDRFKPAEPNIPGVKPQQHAVATASSAAGGPASGAIVCQKCGTEWPGTARFCSKCGSAIAGAASSPGTGTMYGAPSPAETMRTGAPQSEGMPKWVLPVSVGLLVLIALAVYSVRSAIHVARGGGSSSDAADLQAGDGSDYGLRTSPPNAIASVSDLSQAWAAKRFLFRGTDGKPAQAMVVHLPSGEYWGFLLKEPFGDCTLKYVTNVREIASDYGYTAAHPMIVNPCSHAVYDLTQYADAPDGLVRGAIVQGTGLRPPIAVEIQARDNQVFAVRRE